MADTWQQTLSARVTAEYDSNPGMLPNNESGVTRYYFEPGYTLTGRFGEDELRTGIAIQSVRTSNNRIAPDHDNPSIFLDWLRQNNGGEYGISSRYAEIATRDSAIDATGRVPADSTRASRILSGRWSNALNERDTLAIDGSYESVVYKGGNFTDYATRTGSMTHSHDWNENNRTFLKVSHTEYLPADRNTENSFTNTASAGWNWKASENLEGSLQAGRSRIGDGETNTMGSAMIQHTGTRTLLILSADRQITPSGTGGFVLADQVTGSCSYVLNERANTGFDLSMRKVTEAITRIANVWLQYDLDTFWAVRTYYRHNMLAIGGLDPISSNLLGITLSYTHSDF